MPQPSVSFVAVDPTLLEPFVRATHAVFEKQLGFAISSSLVRPVDIQKDTADIGAVVRLNSDRHEGEVGFFMQKEIFLTFYDLFVGVRHEKIVPEIQDAMLEVLNMIYTGARAALLLKKINFERQIPVVLSPEAVGAYRAKANGTSVVTFSSPLGDFFLEMHMKK